MFPDLFCDDVFTLETRRLFLRWPKARDEATLHTLLGEKAVSEMTRRIPHPYPREEAMRYVLAARSKNAEGTGLLLAITPRKQPHQLIGAIGIEPDGASTVEISYWLGMPYWGNGYASEAVQALVDASFSYTQTQKINASIQLKNDASRHVLEKCGFAQAGRSTCIRPVWGDEVPADCYSLSRAVWTSARSSKRPIPNRLQTVESTHYEIS